MLYLAEVQKKGILGGKAELKLLACQRGESWSAVQGEDVIPGEEANSLNAGTLVLVDLTANKQVQRVHQDTAREMVTILQNFSRNQEKMKRKEEEIEQWQQSLILQSEELQKREEELAQQEEDLQTREAKVEQGQAEIQDLEQRRQEIERNRQELENSRQELNTEKQRIQELQTELDQSVKLDDQQANHIQELLDYLSGTVVSTEAVREPLKLTLEIVASQQSGLDAYSQQLDQRRSQVEQQQQAVEKFAAELHNHWKEWHQAQSSLQQEQAELKVRQNTLNLKQSYAQSLSEFLQNHQEVQEQIQLMDDSEPVNIGDKVNMDALEKMSLEELQSVAQNLQQDLEKVFRFVNDQEEELTLQRQTMEDLQRKLANASDSERANLEKELSDEQEGYQMLNETLVGQRRNLREREEILNVHQQVLWRRMGNPPGLGQSKKIDLAPIRQKIETQRQKQAEELQKLQNEIAQIEQNIQQDQAKINNQVSELEARQNEFKQQEQQLSEQRRDLAELLGRVRLYEEMLQPLQDKVNEIRQKLEAAGEALNQVQETGTYQQEAIARLRDALSSLINSQPLQVAAS